MSPAIPKPSPSLYHRGGMTRPTYAFVGRRRGPRLTLASQTTGEGASAVCVFDDPLAAEAFLVVEGLGSGWEVVEHRPGEAAELLLACAAGGAGYVALDPPTALTRGEEEPTLVPIGAFVERLRGE